VWMLTSGKESHWADFILKLFSLIQILSTTIYHQVIEETTATVKHKLL
jgi:hypothetical protein